MYVAVNIEILDIKSKLYTFCELQFHEILTINKHMYLRNELY
jgi:hypothetical protein